mgnify:CR=1 FL=1
MKKKTTFALFFGNRGFMPAELIAGARRDMIKAVSDAGYDYLLLDFGILTDQTSGEFLRCDQRIVIGSLSPWKAHSYHTFFQTYLATKKQQKCMLFLALSGEQKNIHKSIFRYPVSIQFIPFFCDPFHIGKDLFPFLQALLF